MRVALISEHASPLAVLGTGAAGGQNVYLAGLATALADRGHKVEVYTRRDAWQLPARTELVPGVTVIHVTAGPARPASEAERSRAVPAFARRLVRDWSTGAGPDVVHAHRWRSGAAAVLAARSVGVPLVQSFHGLSTGNGYCPAEQAPTEADLLDAVDHVVATGADEAATLATMGLPDDELTLVTGGVDTETFAPEGETWPRGSRPRLLCLGRLAERKGIDTAVKALADLSEAELVVAGGPPAAGIRVDGEAQRLARLAEELDVGRRVSAHRHHQTRGGACSDALGRRGGLDASARTGAAGPTGGDELCPAPGMQCRRCQTGCRRRHHRVARPTRRPCFPGGRGAAVPR